MNDASGYGGGAGGFGGGGFSMHQMGGGGGRAGMGQGGGGGGGGGGQMVSRPSFKREDWDDTKRVSSVGCDDLIGNGSSHINRCFQRINHPFAWCDG